MDGCGRFIGPHPCCTIVTGDAKLLAPAIADGSVDLIFTDPPYTREHIGLYGWLAKEGSRILAPSGFLFAYAGVYWKHEVMRLMADHMDYWFDMVLLNPGNSPIMWSKNVISRYKSILVYVRRGQRLKARVMALSWFPGGGEDKRYHTWGQDESSARYYTDCFSGAAALVWDPFTGGGTVPAVCKILGRHYLAFEIDPDVAERARERVRNTQPPLFLMEPEQVPLGLFATGKTGP